MAKFNVTIHSEKEGLLNGLDRQSIKIIDTSLIDYANSLAGTVTIYIPKVKNVREIGVNVNSSKEDIYDWLQEKFQKGDIFSRSKYNQANLMLLLKRHEVSLTKLRKLIVKGDDIDNTTWNIISCLISYGRLNDTFSLCSCKGFRSFYAIDKAVKDGKLKRFRYGDVVLYID